MGLDMFLEKRVYIGAKCSDKPVDVSINKGGNEIIVNPKKIKYVIEEAAYWRKANMIHKWFVDNVQDGEDDCRDYYVPIEILKELLDRCKKVSENHNLAESLLPTQDGFFFGDTTYNESYFTCIEDTINQLSGVLEHATESDEFYYSSAW